MTKLVTALTALFFLAISSPAGVANQPAKSNCESRAAVLKFLSAQYAEAPVAMGVARNGGLIEVLTSGEGSFTIIVTTPDGLTCMVAAGDGWESLANGVRNTDIRRNGA